MGLPISSDAVEIVVGIQRNQKVILARRTQIGTAFRTASRSSCARCCCRERQVCERMPPRIELVAQRNLRQSSRERFLGTNVVVELRLDASDRSDRTCNANLRDVGEVLGTRDHGEKADDPKHDHDLDDREAPIPSSGVHRAETRSLDSD